MLEIGEELIEKCIKKNRRAQNKLFELCYGIMMSISLRYHKNEEDARYMVSVGFLKVLNSLEKYDRKVKFEYWMRRIMINALIDEYRRNKKRKDLIQYGEVEDSHYQMEMKVTNSAHEKYKAEELEIMIQNLPEDTQKIFNLFAIDGYSHKEISEMMSMPVGTSKWHVSKARQLLQEMIEKSKSQKKIYLS